MTIGDGEGAAITGFAMSAEAAGVASSFFGIAVMTLNWQTTKTANKK